MTTENATIIKTLCEAYHQLSPVMLDKDGNDAKLNVLNTLNEYIKTCAMDPSATQKSEPLQSE